MKKSVLLLFVVGLLGLSACGKNDGKNISLDKKGSSVLTPELVKANIEVNNDNEPRNIPHPRASQEKEFNSSYSIYNSDVGGGIMVLRNSYGYIGFYSTYLNKFIIEPYFEIGTPYNSYNVSQIGRIINVYYNNVYYCFDPFGNFLQLGAAQAIDLASMASRVVYDSNGQSRIVLSFNFNNLDTVEYIYSDDGTATEYNGDLDNNLAPNVNPNAYQEPGQGDFYKNGWLSLDDYGLNNYSLVRNNGYYTIFEGVNAKSSFYIAPDASLIGIFNKKLLTQQVYTMPDDATSFTYSKDGSKYCVESFFVDIESGNKERVNFDGVFQNSSSIVNANKKVEYYEVTYQEITKEKILGNTYRKIVDGSLAVRDDVTANSVSRFVKIDYEGIEYFFNYDNNVLYNRQLKPVTYLNNLYNITLAEKLGILVARNYTGKYGAVAPNGKVVIPFEYDGMYPSWAEDGLMILQKNGDAYRYSYGDISFVASGMNNIADNLFVGQRNDDVYFFSTAGYLFSMSQSEYYSIQTNNNTNILGKYSSMAIYRTNYYSNLSLRIIASDNMSLRNYNSRYSEKTQQVTTNYGTSANDAVRLTLNQQAILASNNNLVTYFYLTCSQTGYYYINSSHSITRYTNTTYQNTPSNWYSSSYYSGQYNYRYEAYMQAGYSYCFYMSLNSTSEIGYVMYQHE